MTLEGKITLSVIPEEYRERKESWEVDEGVEDLKKLLGLDEPAEGDLDEEEEDQSQESEGDDDLEKGDEDKHIPVAKNAFSALMDMDD